MSNTQYEMMAGRIETVFAAHKVAARVWQATVTPRFVRFKVTTALGTKLTAAERLDEELAMSLGASSVRVYRERGSINVEVPRETPRQVALAELLGRIKTIPPLCATLGTDGDGGPLLLRIDSPDVAHVLISGTTGSGKTVLERTLLLSLALTNRVGQLQMVLIDPKGRGLEALAVLPHCWQGLGLVQEPEDAGLTLAILVAEMERRDRERVRMPHIVVAIDELADLLQMGGSPVEQALNRLTQRGREAGIHVIAATQRPAAALIGGAAKANFPVRLVGSVTSADDARVAAGISGTGAESLLGRGDFICIAKGQQIRFQAAYASDGEIRRLAGLAATGERKTRGWTVETLGREVAWAPAQGRRTAAEVAEALGVGSADVGVGSGVGNSAALALFAGVRGHILAHPTPPTTRRPLRERYTPDELRGFLDASGGRLKEAAEAAFGYSDTTTLGIMREVAQLQVERGTDES